MSGIQSTQPSSPLLSPPSLVGGINATNYASLGSSVQAYMTGMDAQLSTSSTSAVDVVNITGSGVLEFAALQVSSPGGQAGRLQILIDGVQVCDATTGAAVNHLVCPVGNISSSAGNVGSVSLAAVPFSKSLQIRIFATVAAPVSGWCKYRRNT